MSDALSNTNSPTLSNAPEAASLPTTPGQTEASFPADRPAAQGQTTPTTSQENTSVLPAQLPYTPADWVKQLTQQLGLNQEQVDKLLAFETAYAAHQAQLRQEDKNKQFASWARQTRALYGAGLEEEITFALRAANKFGGPELRALLEETGLGNHPVVIRTLSGIGRTISEDACLGGTPAAPQDKTFAQALYGTKN